MSGSNQDSKPPQPLSRWLWRSFLRSALLPVLAIELALLAAYWGSTYITYQNNLAVISAVSTDDFSRMAQREAQIVGSRLESIARMTRLFADQSLLALQSPATVGAAERQRYRLLDDGRYVTTQDNGGAAAFYSGVVPVGPVQIDKALRTAQLDPLMKSIVSADPLIRQLYLNTDDSFNRIYPYLDVSTAYEAGMRIPDYNFYYEADAAHNPGRDVVWTDVYVDPAGGGWLLSSIAPVYEGERLEGVVGIDVTIRDLVNHVLALTLPWKAYGVLLSRDGTVLALPEAGEADWGLTGSGDFDYQQAILADTFRPDDYNVRKRPDLANLAAALARQPDGGTYDDLTMAGARLHATWARVPGPGWTLLLLAPESEIIAEAGKLNQRLNFIGVVMIASLVLFYIVLLLWLLRRAAVLSSELTRPMVSIAGLLSEIGRGRFVQAQPELAIAELDSVGGQVVGMGRKLGEANEALLQAQSRLTQALLDEQRLSESQRQFISMVSHEFRNPLSIIDSTAQTLARRGDRMDPSALAERAGDLRAAVRRLMEVIDSALVFARTESAGATGEHHLVALLDGVRLNSLAQHHGRGMDLELEPTIPDHPVRCDPSMLRVLCSILVDNALRSTVAGTPVRIGASISAREYRVWVNDAGPGLDQATIDQLRRSPQDASGSVGTGLRLARVFADMYGGRLDIDSSPGQGCHVSVLLPVKRQAAGREVSP